jgi:hypothetical protein
MKTLSMLVLVSFVGMGLVFGKPGGGHGEGKGKGHGKSKNKVEHVSKKAKIKDHDFGHGPKGKTHFVSSDPAQVVITPRERILVRDKILLLGDDGWREYNLKATSLPPGLAKKVARGGSLPPGWQKKVVVGEVLPGSIFDLASPVPDVFLVDVPRIPGTNLLMLGGKLIRVNPGRTVLDVVDLGL